MQVLNKSCFGRASDMDVQNTRVTESES